MRCKICGAKLKTEGDICTYCYKLYQEEEDLKKDTVEKLKLKRKYAIAFEIVKYVEITIVCVLALILCLSMRGFLEALGVIGVYLLIMGLLFFLDKRIAIGTKAVFYERKVVYNFDFLFIHVEKVVKYSDLRDITYFQTHRQKKFGYGDICVYTKDKMPGASFFKGFQLKNVEDVQEVLAEISELVGTLSEE